MGLSLPLQPSLLSQLARESEGPFFIVGLSLPLQPSLMSQLARDFDMFIQVHTLSGFNLYSGTFPTTAA